MRYGIIEINQPNLDHHHLYLSSIYDLFPRNSIGGGSEADQAPQLLEVHSGIGGPIATDIAGDKKIFRRRAWVREFFEVHQLKAGDRVVVERTGPYRFHVYQLRAGPF